MTIVGEASMVIDTTPAHACEECGVAITRPPGTPGRWPTRCTTCKPPKPVVERTPDEELRAENGRLRRENGRLRERLEALTGEPA